MFWKKGKKTKILTTDKHWRSKLFFQILRNTFFTEALTGYVIFIFAASYIIWWVEPSMETFGNALWYSFVSGTTIGFGDFAAAGVIGRVLTVCIYIYTVLIIALLTALFTALFFEMAKVKKDEALAKLQGDLEHLEDLPKERLREISKEILRITKEK